MSMSQPQHAGYPPQPPARGSSGCWWACGCGCLLMLLLCCGGIVGGGLYLYMAVKDAYVADPNAAVEASNSIAEFDVEDLEPQGAIRVDLPVLGRAVSGAIYQSEDKRSTLVLIQIELKIEGVNPEDMLNGMRDALQKDEGAREDAVVVEAPKSVKAKMRGTDETAIITRFRPKTSPAGTGEYWEAKATFQGKKGPALVVLIVPADEWTEDDIRQWLESFK